MNTILTLFAAALLQVADTTTTTTPDDRPDLTWLWVALALLVGGAVGYLIGKYNKEDLTPTHNPPRP
jgi:membrane protein DedA with SNARE-associated domain